MTFTSFGPPPDGAAGFATVAGAEHGMQRLLVAGGRLPAGDRGPMHVHEGDEVIHVLAGELVVRCDTQRRVCRAGDVVIVPPGVVHGFHVLADAVLEVVAEQEIGTLYPVRTDADQVELVEVYEPDLPWGRPPPDGQAWTTADELSEIFDRLAYDV